MIVSKRGNSLGDMDEEGIHRRQGGFDTMVCPT